jgi:hypothetical protein
MNPRLLSISFVSFVPPITLSLFMYVSCKYVEQEAESIVTEREEEEEQRRGQDLPARNSIPTLNRPSSSARPTVG